PRQAECTAAEVQPSHLPALSLRARRVKPNSQTSLPKRRNPMSVISWLRNWTPSSTPGRRRTRGAARKPATFRPRLDALDGRYLPSALAVTSTLDSGPGSLRDEVAAAKAGDTIIFSSAVKNQTITLTSQVDIRQNLTIQGPGAGQLTISG